jgi:hypothetical protein
MKKNLIFIATLSLMAGATSAQTVPNAGVLLNQHKQGAPKNDESLVSASSDQQVVFKGLNP